MPCTWTSHFIGLYKAESYECWNLKETGAQIFECILHFSVFT